MKYLTVSFISIFMLFLLIPGIFVDLSSNRISKEENRVLAKPPAIDNIRRHPTRFFSGFESWFKDSTAFRESFMKIYKTLVNNELENNRYTEGRYIYLIGREGHRYFASIDGEMIPKFQGKSIFAPNELQNMSRKIEDIKNYLEKKNIHFVLMFCADKETIYPEYYPRTIMRGPEPVQLEIVTKYLREHANVDVFNIRKVLIDEKPNYPLYNKSIGDLTHYNEIAAFFAYRELMKHITPYFPQIVPYDLGDVNIIHENNEVTRVSLKQKISYKKLNDDFFDGADLSRYVGWENVAFENNHPGPVILFLRDSYANENYFSKYIAQQFGRTILIHYENLKYFEQYIEKYKPDIVVFESAEYKLKDFGYRLSQIQSLH